MVGAGEQPLRDVQAWRLGRKRQEKRSHSIPVAIRTATNSVLLERLRRARLPSFYDPVVTHTIFRQ